MQTDRAWRHLCRVALLAAALPCACSGDITTGDPDPEGGGSEARFARLTHAQWENTVEDLFRLSEPPGLAV